MKHSLYRACLSLSIAGLATAQSLSPPAASNAGQPSDAPSAPHELAQPKPPVVTCNGDQLTIEADDSKISAILSKLRPCIGLEIAIPAEYEDERIFVHLGPGPRTDILDSLLASTDLNYVITTSTSSPLRIMEVNLTVRPDKPAAGDENRPTTPPADLAITPARRAWLAALSAAKHGSPTVDGEQPPQASEAPTHAAQPNGDSTTALTSAINEHNGDHSGNTEQAAATLTTTSLGNAAGTPTAPEMPPSTDSKSDNAADDRSNSTASPALQKQIDQMQQLFEQRKKMMDDHSNPPSKP